MLCDSCGISFENTGKGSGGQNRRYCFSCLPSGLDRNLRSKLRFQLLQRKSDEFKLSLGCSVCGYNKCATALEWHHKDPNKENNPSDLLKRSWEVYLKEINKCTLFCSNCHREEHERINSM